MFLRCVLMVWKLEKRFSAISFVVMPNAMHFRISVSVFVSFTMSSEEEVLGVSNISAMR